MTALELIGKAHLYRLLVSDSVVYPVIAVNWHGQVEISFGDLIGTHNGEPIYRGVLSYWPNELIEAELL